MFKEENGQYIDNVYAKFTKQPIILLKKECMKDEIIEGINLPRIAEEAFDWLIDRHRRHGNPSRVNLHQEIRGSRLLYIYNYIIGTVVS